MARWKNVDWVIGGRSKKESDYPACDSQASLAILMDIRDELQTLNRVFQCKNFLAIPRVLAQIRRNTTKKRRARK